LLRFSRLTEPENGAFLRGGEVVLRESGKEIVVCSVDDIPLRGTCNQENVLAACCAASRFGLSVESITRAIREMKPVEHRLEPVAVIDSVEYLNNSMCTNVAAVVRSIEAIDEPVVVIAGGIHKGGDLRPFARTVASRVRHLVLIGRSAEEIRDAVTGEGCDRITLAGSLRDAVLAARSKAAPGDVVMLAPGCASFDMFRSFEDRGEQFKEIVKEMKAENLALEEDARA